MKEQTAKECADRLTRLGKRHEAEISYVLSENDKLRKQLAIAVDLIERLEDLATGSIKSKIKEALARIKGEV